MKRHDPVRKYPDRIGKALICLAFMALIIFLPGCVQAADITTLEPIHTRDEIENEFRNEGILNIMNTPNTEFISEPNSDTYTSGQVSESSLNDGLSMLNFMRYLAGLNPVTLDSSYTESAQAASVLIDHLGYLSHTPDISDFPGISSSFYQLGYSGTLHSNLASGCNIVSSIGLYMADDGNYNTMGHRAWLLNPSMGKTGFGECGSYTATYAADTSGTSTFGEAITWPSAGAFPYEFQMPYYPDSGFDRWNLFFSPWTCRLNMSYYQCPDISQMRITVTNKTTGKQTIIEKDASSDPENLSGFKRISTSAGCTSSARGVLIIFRPDWEDLEDYYTLCGSTINVTIEGLMRTDGSDDTLTYDINFFRLVEKPVTGIEIPQNEITLQLYGDNIDLSCKVIPADAECQTIGYQSSNENVVTVSSDGYAVPEGTGEADITVTTLDGAYTGTIHVTVTAPIKAVQGISLSQTSLSLESGTAAALTASITPEDASNKNVRWSTSDPSVVTVANGTLTAVSPGEADITAASEDGDFTAVCHVKVTKPYQIAYMTQIQDIGWEAGYKLDGESSGTVGQSKRLETIKIKVNPDLGSGDIQYKTHVQDIGWMDYVGSDQQSGTVGESKRLEAIQIKLTGDLADNYDVYYCVHAQNFGWMGWAKNDEKAGTAGYAYRLESIKIQLVKKGDPAPAAFEGQSEDAFSDKATLPAVSYRTHVQDFGWQSYVENGAVSGTVGQCKRLEGINIDLKNMPYEGGIEYRTHIENIGWESAYKSAGAMSGTSGRSLRLEAIQIRLTGELADHYDVYYQVHAENFGWLAMAKNDEQSGTAGYAYRLEGIRVLLVKKGDPAPAGVAGTQAKAFYSK